MHSPELLKGTLQTIVLKVLKDNGRMYGYEITQRVKELSDDRILITEGALYPALHKLEAEGMLKTETENCSLRPPHTFGKPFQSRSIESSLLAKPTPCALLPLEETLAYLASCFLAAAINKRK